MSSSNINQIIGKEFFIGVLNGIIFAVITAVVVHLWFKQIDLSIIIAASMVLNMIVAGLFWHLNTCYTKKNEH